jgi:hypothetical protein
LTGTAVADFGGQISLLGHTSVPAKIVAGEILPLTFLWQAQAEISSDYKVFVHLLDGEGRIVAQRDSEAVGGWRPTTGWRVGEYVRDNHGLLLPEDVVPGEYKLIAGLYDPEGERLTVRDTTGHVAGDSLSLGTVQVIAACHCEITQDATERLKYEEAATDELAWEDE